jgi:hypothetical protein
MLVATRYATEIRSSSNDEAHANLKAWASFLWGMQNGNRTFLLH